jgi:hypothetical protein
LGSFSIKALSLFSKMKLDKKIFWDIDFNQLDYDKYAEWIIVRVFERGDVDDIRQVRRHYGDELVKTALLNTKSFRKARLHLAAAVIDEPIEKFRCYIEQQSNPERFWF